MKYISKYPKDIITVNFSDYSRNTVHQAECQRFRYQTPKVPGHFQYKEFAGIDNLSVSLGYRSMYPASFDGLQLMTNNNAHYSQWSPPVFNCQCPYRIVAKPDQIKLCFTSRKLYFDIKSITGPERHAFCLEAVYIQASLFPVTLHCNCIKIPNRCPARVYREIPPFRIR